MSGFTDPTTYFNEFDNYPARWLRNLFPDAVVDDRSIKDVQREYASQYIRSHFFAGIGGWEYALQLSGWPADREVWTGSCPCQPFSQAGKRKGGADSRHLWPEFLRLIKECRPATIFGEQVASKDGREWLAGIFVDLEALGYAVAGADLCAAGVGAPHIRQRLYWVANACGERRQQDTRSSFSNEGSNGRGKKGNNELAGSSESVRWLSDSDRARSEIFINTPRWPESCDTGVIYCKFDGMFRRIEPGIMPLVDGVPARMGKLRAYGNAVVPQVAATFIKAFMETEKVNECTR